jgi:uncharacterized protein (TIGR02453 family)
MTVSFKGFSRELPRFLDELASHNRKEWFDANRSDYEDHYVEAAKSFVEAIGPRLRKLTPGLIAEPRINGAIMRINRDVRFSKDKTPYKTNVGIQFRHSAGKDVHAPGLYLHIEIDEVFLGSGIWRPEAEGLANIRKAMIDSPAKWKKASQGAGFRKRRSSSASSRARTDAGEAPFSKGAPSSSPASRAAALLTGSASPVLGRRPDERAGSRAARNSTRSGAPGDARARCGCGSAGGRSRRPRSPPGPAQQSGRRARCGPA